MSIFSEHPDSDMQQEFPRWFETKVNLLYVFPCINNDYIYYSSPSILIFVHRSVNFTQTMTQGVLPTYSLWLVDHYRP